MKHGIHDGIPEHEYHADPALSQSQAKTLLDCPARLAWQREHPIKPTAEMELGTVIHALTFGTPDPHVVIDADSWRTKAAKDAADEARAAGLIPVLAKDMPRAQECARKVREHPYVAGALTQGAPEQSMWWRDEDTGVECRGRIDWLTVDDAGTPVLLDLKTTGDVSGDGWGTHVARYGYHLQAAAYLDGFRTLTGQEATFLYVAVERDAPHFIRVYYPTPDVLHVGLERWREALTTYRDCVERDEWPGYPTHPTPFDLPRWAA